MSYFATLTRLRNRRLPSLSLISYPFQGTKQAACVASVSQSCGPRGSPVKIGYSFNLVRRLFDREHHILRASHPRLKHRLLVSLQRLSHLFQSTKKAACIV